MSVDDRLREAFGETDRSWDEHTAAALHEVTSRQRRERVTRRTAITLTAAAATAAVVLVVTNPGDQDQTPAPEPPPTSTPTSDVANPLDGHWVSEPLTRADVRRAARRAGDASDAATMLEGLPALPFRVTLFIDGTRNEMTTHTRHDGQEVLMDQENIDVEGDRVQLTAQFADGGTLHGWSLEGETLRLDFVATTEGLAEGIPGEAWQRLLYDSKPFTRQE
jgi:hypothetical protein